MSVRPPLWCTERGPRPSVLRSGAQGRGTRTHHPGLWCKRVGSPIPPPSAVVPKMGTQSRHPVPKSATAGRQTLRPMLPPPSRAFPPHIVDVRRGGTSTTYPDLTRTRVEMYPPLLTYVGVESTPSALCCCTQGWRTIPSTPYPPPPPLSPRVHAEWYAVLPTPGSPLLSPHHRLPRAGDNANARVWLAAPALARAWRQCRRVHVAFHAP